MADITYTDKIAGSTFSHEDANEIKTAVNSKVDKVTGDRLITAAEISKLATLTDEIIEVDNYEALPGIGTTGILYVTLDTNFLYRWTGSVYTEVSAGIALGETSITAYRGDRGKTAYDHSQDSVVHVTSQNKSDLAAVTLPTIVNLITGSNAILFNNILGQDYGVYNMTSGNLTLTAQTNPAPMRMGSAFMTIIADGSHTFDCTALCTGNIANPTFYWKGTFNNTAEVVNELLFTYRYASDGNLKYFAEVRQKDQ